MGGEDLDYQRQADRDRYMLGPEKKQARSRVYYAANRERINSARRRRNQTRSLEQGRDV
jgi:hypothetical protein